MHLIRYRCFIFPLPIKRPILALFTDLGYLFVQSPKKKMFWYDLHIYYCISRLKTFASLPILFLVFLTIQTFDICIPLSISKS